MPSITPASGWRGSHYGKPGRSIPVVRADRNPGVTIAIATGRAKTRSSSLRGALSRQRSEQRPRVFPEETALAFRTEIKRSGQSEGCGLAGPGRVGAEENAVGRVGGKKLTASLQPEPLQ